jgi:PAS domain S-box-containing protein
MAEADGCYFRALIDRMDTAVLIADDERVYVDLNAAACRMLRFEREQLLGRRISDLTQASLPEAALKAQWEAFLREGAQAGRIDLTLGDGTQGWFQYTAHAHFVPGRHCTFINPELGGLPEADSGEFLTICAWTKKVRMGEEWVPIDVYLHRKWGIRVSHGICPEAMKTA